MLEFSDMDIKGFNMFKKTDKRESTTTKTHTWNLWKIIKWQF